MYKITHIKKNCIGCGACVAIAPEFWEMDENGLSHLKGSSTDENGNDVREIDDNDAEINQEAADACPVQIIKVEKKTS
jgi:ferredoxin